MNDYSQNQYAVPGGIVLEAAGVTGQQGTFRVSTTGAVTKVYDHRLLKVFSYEQKLYGMHYPDNYDLATIVVTSTTGEEWTPYMRLNADAMFLDFKESQSGELIAYSDEQLLYIPRFGPDSIATVQLNVGEITTNPITTVAALDSTLYVGTLSGLFYRNLAEALADEQDE